jgi:hypothetical protein
MDEDKRNQLEQEFEKAFNEVNPKIQAKLEQAATLIREAVSLSEESGIPFRPSRGLLGFRMSYIPSTLNEKWAATRDENGDWDDDWYDFWTQVTGAHGGSEYDGWQSSQTC